MGCTSKDETASNRPGNGSPPDSMSTIGRKTTLIFIIKMLVTISSFVGFFYVARFMGPEVVGIIGFALGFVGIFMQSDYGFGMAHNKRISEGRNIDECLGAYALIRTIITSAGLVLLLLCLFFWEGILGHGYEDPVQKDVVLVILVYYVLFTMSDISTQTFGGLRQSAKQQAPELIGTLARIPVMIIVAMAALGVVVLAMSYILTGILMLATGLFMLRKFRITRPSKPILRSYARFAGPIALMSIVSTVSVNVDKVIIQFFWNSTEVGYFFGVQRLTTIMLAISGSIAPIFFASISYFHARKSKKTIRHLVLLAERYLSMIITPMVVAFIVLAAPIIVILLSSGFLPGVQIMVWLSIYCLIITLIQPYSYFLMGCNEPGLAAKAGIIMAALNIILLMVFVPRSLFGISLFGYGATGAAMAITISTFIGGILIKTYSHRVGGLRSSGRIFKHWAAGALMGAIVYLIINHLWPVSRFYDLAMMLGICLALYLGFLALMKEFGKKELMYFLDILNMRKMAKYIGLEMRE